MTNYVYIASSLDGFIATPSGGINWLNNLPNPSQSDFGYSDFVGNINAIVMGKNSFEKILTFDNWPYDKPVFVLSTTLKEIPKKFSGKAEIVNDDVRKLVKKLNQRGFKNLYIDGGKTIQSFLKADAIDELIITRIPILLGDGIPLFSTLNQKLKFKHKKTTIYNNSLVKSHYVRERE